MPFSITLNDLNPDFISIPSRRSQKHTRWRPVTMEYKQELTHTLLKKCKFEWSRV